MAKHRSHRIDFKRQVAQEFIAGETLHGLAKRYDVCRQHLSLFSPGPEHFGESQFWR
jgi:transposase